MKGFWDDNTSGDKSWPAYEDQKSRFDFDSQPSLSRAIAKLFRRLVAAGRGRRQ